MNTATDMIEGIAEALAEAERQARPMSAPREVLPGLSIETAYMIQQAGMARRIGKLPHLNGVVPTQRDHAPVVVGHKVGVTSLAVQQWLGFDQPDFGVLLDSMRIPAGVPCPGSTLIKPRIEAELAFVMRTALPRQGCTPADVLRATAYVVPALEVIDSRIADWNLTIVDTVADNASSAYFTLGLVPIDPTGLDMRLMGMTLQRQGEVVATGAGAACLGHPAEAVAWLARTLGAAGGGIEAGHIVLSGALGPVVPFLPGDVVTAILSGVGSVSLAREVAR